MQFWQELFAARADRMKASDIREAFKLAERGDIISFAGGFPAPETFPAAEVAEVADYVARVQGASGLQYGPTEGIYALRELVATTLSAQGIECVPEEVIITNGSQQALDLIAKIFMNPGDGVIVEQPAYIGGLSAFAHYEVDFIGVPMDEAGMNVELLAQRLRARKASGVGGRLKLCYTVPNFQNPSGVSLSEERRQALAELAEIEGFCIVEDNPYGELRFEGAPKAHIKTFDSAGRVLYLGSFSKVFLPGFRLGYVVGPLPAIQKLAIAKQGADLCSNSFGQRVILECARRGMLDANLRRSIDVYRAKRDLMLESLGVHFPAEVQWTYPEGGFFVWVTLPQGMDAKRLLPEAVREERVAYVSGGACFPDGSGANTIRLAFSQAANEEIVEGVRRLGRFLARRLSGSASAEPAGSSEKEMLL